MQKNAHLVDLEECCKLRITAAADLLALLFDHLHLGDVVLLLPLALELRGFLLRLCILPWDQIAELSSTIWYHLLVCFKFLNEAKFMVSQTVCNVFPTHSLSVLE